MLTHYKWVKMSTMYPSFPKAILFLLVLMLLISAGSTHCLAAFTIDDEKKLGREIYDKLYNKNFLLSDPKLSAYVSAIGNRVLSQSEKASFQYTFSIFNSSAINAFATPGGYIYVNKGLITAVENEAQLAGVLAHEIAHANARHVASIISKSQKLNIAAMAAIIAGAFLGGGGEATAAIAAFSVAGASAMTLKYSRDHEEEADRLGLGYLVQAGYYPQAMVEFLKIIKQFDFLSRSIPSYLKTHPGTDDRMFYLDTLILTHYASRTGASNIVGNFRRMQALVISDIPDMQKRSRQLSQALDSQPEDVDLLYALALTQDYLGKTHTALEFLNRALILQPKDEDLLKTAGLLYLKTGAPEKAQPLLTRALLVDPNNKPARLALGKTSFALGDYQSALSCFLALENEIILEPDIYYHIAMSYGRLNHPGDAHYYFGLHFRKDSKPQSALFHFRKAQAFFPEGSQRRLNIDEAIRALSPAN